MPINTWLAPVAVNETGRASAAPTRCVAGNIELHKSLTPAEFGVLAQKSALELSLIGAPRMILPDFYARVAMANGDPTAGVIVNPNNKGPKRTKTLSELQDQSVIGVANPPDPPAVTLLKKRKGRKARLEFTVGDDFSLFVKCFIIQSVQEAMREAYQVISGFSKPYILLKGNLPEFISISGTLIDAPAHDDGVTDYEWYHDWQYYYREYLRGTRQAEMAAACTLVVGNLVVKGVIVGTNISHTVGSGPVARFNFNMFVIDKSIIRSRSLPPTKDLPANMEDVGSASRQQDRAAPDIAGPATSGAQVRSMDRTYIGVTVL